MNCIELLQIFTNNVKVRLSLIYLTIVSQFYNRRMNVGHFMVLKILKNDTVIPTQTTI